MEKRKRESEEGKVKKEEGNSSNMKVQHVVSTELLPPKLPMTRSLKEEERFYQMVKDLFLHDLEVVVVNHHCIRRVQ